MSSGNSSPRKALIILGMHRSGTSAVTRACNLLGVELGSNLMQPGSDNEAGFWESWDIVNLHDKILDALGSNWDDVRPLPAEWQNRAEIAPLKTALREIVETQFSSDALWGFKDPRACRLLPAWKDALEETEPCYLIVRRSPAEVAKSLKARERFDARKSWLLWAWHYLEAERETRGSKRAFVSFREIFKNPAESFAAIGKALGISWPSPYEEAIRRIEESFRPGLIHNTPDETPSSGSELIDKWAAAIEAELAAAESGKKPSARKLDSVRKEMLAYMEDIESEFGYLVSEAALYRKELNNNTLELLGRLQQSETRCYQQGVEFNKTMNSLREEMETRDRLNKSLSDHIKGLEVELHIAVNQTIAETSRANELQGVVNALVNSTSWRITKPIRMAKKLYNARRFFLEPRYWRKAWWIYRQFGLREAIMRFSRFKPAMGVDGNLDPRSISHDTALYRGWAAIHDTITGEDRAKIAGRIKALEYKPLFSIVMPVYNVEEKWLRRALDSVLAQVYGNFELCIADDASTKPHVREILTEYMEKDSRVKVVFREANGHISEASNSAIELAAGDYIVLMDNDDTIPEHALYCVAEEINRHPEADMLYSDENLIDENDERYSPYFKSSWNPELFFCQNMFSHLGVYRASLIHEIGGFRKGYEGSQDYDLALRCLLRTSHDKIIHIPHVLYNWRAIPGSTALEVDNKNYAVSASRRALSDYLSQVAPGALVTAADSLSMFNRVVWPVPSPEPEVAIIIPTRDRADLLKKCISSILDKTDYRNYRILIVNNQSAEAETLAYFKEIALNPRVSVMDFDEPFNYSKINNSAVSRSQSPFICFMNNDIEITTPEWLKEMVSQAARKEVGAVGAKLLYQDGRIQHCGIILGAGTPNREIAVGAHMCHWLPGDDWGYFGRAVLPQALSAVTAALMVIRREVFEAAGGFNEKDLPVDYNDVDLCLKIRKLGYRVVFTPYAKAIHHGSASRGDKDTSSKLRGFSSEVAYMRNNWGKEIDNDPYYNPNLDLLMADFRLGKRAAKKYWEEENAESEERAEEKEEREVA